MQLVIETVRCSDSKEVYCSIVRGGGALVSKPRKRKSRG
jgi:hypothetical protein